MIFMQILLLAVWIYLLSVFHRNGLAFWKYLFGSIGLLLLCITAGYDLLGKPVGQLTTFFAGQCGGFLNTVSGVDQSHAMLWISTRDGAISFPITAESSGFFELAVFTSLLWFLPLFSIWEKLSWQFVGTIWLTAANILRLLLIFALVAHFGEYVYYLANTVAGRLIFFLCTAALYFTCLTAVQVRRQIPGGLQYGK